MSKREFKSTKVNVTKVTPLRDDILTTGNLIIQESEDMLDKGKVQKAFHWVQEIIAVGPNAPEVFEIGQKVRIDIDFMQGNANAQDRTIQILNQDQDDMALLLPSRYIICIIEGEYVEEDESETISLIEEDNNTDE